MEMKSGRSGIPKNYFCKFSHTMTKQEFHTITVFRYDQSDRYQTNEEIEFKVIFGDGGAGNLNEFVEDG
jgi:hypothetical protein